MFFAISAILLVPPLIFYILISALAASNNPEGASKHGRATDHLDAYISYLVYYLIYLLAVPLYYGIKTLLSGSIRDRKEKEEPLRLVVILSHGFMSTPVHWSIFRWRLSKMLDPRRDDIRAFGYNSISGDFDKWVGDLTEKIRGIKADRIILAGHSLGGLISIWAAERIGDGPGVPAIKVISYGTPFNGTRMAKYSVSKNGRKLQPGMRIPLETQRMLASRRFDLTCYWSDIDKIVVPTASASPRQGRSIEVKGMSHPGWFFAKPERDEYTGSVTEPDRPASNVRP